MTAEIISLADRRRAAALPPPGSGNVAIAAAALAVACRALTASLDKVRHHSAAIRADMERLQQGAVGRSLTGAVHV